MHEIRGGRSQLGTGEPVQRAAAEVAASAEDGAGALEEQQILSMVQEHLSPTLAGLVVDYLRAAQPRIVSVEPLLPGSAGTPPGVISSSVPSASGGPLVPSAFASVPPAVHDEVGVHEWMPYVLSASGVACGAVGLSLLGNVGIGLGISTVLSPLAPVGVRVATDAMRILNVRPGLQVVLRYAAGAAPALAAGVAAGAAAGRSHRDPMEDAARAMYITSYAAQAATIVVSLGLKMIYGPDELEAMP